jgi:putative N-acetyltransferase (TIGR04045 family)
MTDATVWGEPVSRFFSAIVTAQVVNEAWQRHAYLALRHEIFVAEQAMFDTSDVDEHDDVATPIVALSHAAGMPDEVIGGVRIYPARRGTWFGGRLGVCKPYRSRGVVGSALIFAAVSTARARGCARFLATIQDVHVAYFERHRFFSIRPVDLCGRPHRLMEADLTFYPARVADALQPVDGAHAVSALQSRRAA